MTVTPELTAKYNQLKARIASLPSLAVAFSGGVDSTLLLKVVHDVLGHENTLAVFAETPLLPPGEGEAAKQAINFVGSRLLTVGLNPLVWPEFIENPPERCYLCKKKIYQTFQEKLAELDFNILMDGTNLDDLSDFRPGLKALHELNVRTPLADAGLTKNEVRQLSKSLDLPNWDKHSSSCLATRVATGQFIDEEKLEIIKQCENYLQSLNFRGCRVRLSADSAIIELQEKDIEKLADGEKRRSVLKKFSNFNIKKLFLDLEGRKGI